MRFIINYVHCDTRNIRTSNFFHIFIYLNNKQINYSSQKFFDLPMAGREREALGIFGRNACSFYALILASMIIGKFLGFLSNPTR